jgi:hypothetical protein
MSTMLRQLREADISINGQALSQAQSATLRVALISAQVDFRKLGPDITTAGHVLRIDEILGMIGNTKVEV